MTVVPWVFAAVAGPLLCRLRGHAATLAIAVNGEPWTLCRRCGDWWSEGKGVGHAG